MGNILFKDIVPLIATVTGGILATVGGILGNYLLNRNSARFANRKSKLLKLEETYELLNTHKKWIINEMNAVVSRTENEKIENPIDRIRLIVHLYFPEEKKHFAELEVSNKIFRDALFMFLKNYIDNKMENNNEEFQKLKKPFENVISSTEVFTKQIEKKFSKYLEGN